MTVRTGLLLYGVIGVPVVLVLAVLLARVHPWLVAPPVLVWAVFGAVFLRCPRCRQPAGWTLLKGPLATDFAARTTPVPHTCSWCALDFGTARFSDRYPPDQP